MLRPNMVVWSMVGLEHTSCSGSASPIMVMLLAVWLASPNASWVGCSSLPVASCTLVVWEKPLAWPEIRLMAPGDDGPNWVLKLLSLIA